MSEEQSLRESIIESVKRSMDTLELNKFKGHKVMDIDADEFTTMLVHGLTGGGDGFYITVQVSFDKMNVADLLKMMKEGQ